jgi:hypothetical protein
VRNTMSWLPAYLVFGASLAALLACERSESVGWADREGPGSVAPPRTGAASSSPSPSEQAAPGSPSAIVLEYQQLAMALDTLRQRAMADEVLAAEWRRLQADLEARIAEGSAFHRELIARRAEIEARWAEAQETGVPIPREELQQLIQHYSNIRAEFSRARNQLLEEDPELAARLIALQRRTFDKMRELEPARAAEIDRVEELENLLFRPQSPLPERDSTASDPPG